MFFEAGSLCQLHCCLKPRTEYQVSLRSSQSLVDGPLSRSMQCRSSSTLSNFRPSTGFHLTQCSGSPTGWTLAEQKDGACHQPSMAAATESRCCAIKRFQEARTGVPSAIALYFESMNQGTRPKAEEHLLFGRSMTRKGGKAARIEKSSSTWR